MNVQKIVAVLGSLVFAVGESSLCLADNCLPPASEYLYERFQKKSIGNAKLVVQLDFDGLTQENLQVRLEQMRRAGADGLLIGCGEFFADGQIRQEKMNFLSEVIRYYENAGISVGVWIGSLGYFGKRGGDFARRFPNARQLKSFSGVEACYCATDPLVFEATAEMLRDVIKAGAKFAIFDDDLVQSCRPGVACVCDEHLRRYAKRLGRSVSVKELVASLEGGPNDVRTAMFDVMGESLMDFCRGLRSEADKVDPQAEIGICTSISHYDIDGVDYLELIHALQPPERGKRPIVRLSGATYWGAPYSEGNPRNFGQGLGGIAEFVRWQAARFRESGVIVLDENDTHPRDSSAVPAGMCEAYDQVILTEDSVIRNKYILRDRYVFKGNASRRSIDSGVSDPAYLTAHLASRSEAIQIERQFRGTRPVGFRVFMPEHFIRDAVLPAPYMGDAALLKYYSQPIAGIYLAANGLPTQYVRDDQPWAAFGCGAVKLPEQAFRQGVLLDREAAEALAKKGVDTGVGKTGGRKIGEWTLYANAKGERFAVLDRSMYEVDCGHLARERVPAEEIWRFLAGSELPARAEGADGLYLRVGERPGKSLSVHVANMRPKIADSVSVSVLGKRQTFSLAPWKSRSYVVGNSRDRMTVAKDGQLMADIIIPASPTIVERFAAKELKHHIGLAFGTYPVILSERRIAESRCASHFFVGRTEAAANAGFLDRVFEPEERLVRVMGSDCYFIGGDSEVTKEELINQYAVKSTGTLFAVYDFLEHELDVKWIWPGSLGEVVPERTDLVLGALDRSGREPLVWRTWATGGADAEYGFSKASNRDRFFRDENVFLLRHRIGKRVAIGTGHAFTDWWKRFGKEHPEYFNLLPNGKREPFEGYDRVVTMCVSEPGVHEQLIKDWDARCRISAGSRKSYLPWVNCCENDRPSKCICKHCRSWDGPDPQFKKSAWWNGALAEQYAKSDGQTPFLKFAAEAVESLTDGTCCMSWMHRKDKHIASLSDRYARFYNAILVKARPIRPGTRVVGYAYENYEDSPLVARVDPDVVLDFVPRSFFPYEPLESVRFRRIWAGWQKAGAVDMIYRPNYTLAGGNYPMDFARRALDDFAFAATNGMVACHFDSLLGAYSSHAMAAYAFNRTIREPTRGYQAAREDMLSAFGSAAEAVGRYFDAVEAHSADWNYDQWRKIALANKVGKFMGGSFPTPAAVLEEFFTEKDLAGYHALLEDAERAAKGDELVLQRIAFLHKGIRDTELTRKFRIAQKRLSADRDDASAKAAYEAAFAAMAAYRASVEADGVCNYARIAPWEQKLLGWPHAETEKDSKESADKLKKKEKQCVY